MQKFCPLRHSSQERIVILHLRRRKLLNGTVSFPVGQSDVQGQKTKHRSCSSKTTSIPACLWWAHAEVLPSNSAFQFYSFEQTRSSTCFLSIADPNVQASILFAQNGVPYTFQNGVAFFHGNGQEGVYPSAIPSQPQVMRSKQTLERTAAWLKK